MTKSKRIAFFSKKSERSAKAAKKAIKYLESKLRAGTISELLVEDTTAYYLKYKGKRASAPEIRKADCIIVVGGDGTFLSIELQYPGIPKIGINTGIVGFLAQLTEKNFTKGLDLFFKGKYWVDYREKLECIYNGKTAVALNDILVHSKVSARVISMDIATRHFTKALAGDGVLFSTPTGSTAYSFSAGGPIVHPKVDCIILTPVCPVNVLKRPIVLPSSTVFSITITGERPAMVSIDGRLDEQVEKLTIRHSKKKAKLVKIYSEDLWHKVEAKLLSY